MFIGFGIKMALFPLHGWLPGAYTRAPDAISPLLAALMTKVALYGWVRIMFWVLWLLVRRLLATCARTDITWRTRHAGGRS